MFYNTETQELMTYEQLKALPQFSRVGFPSDSTVIGIDDLISEHNIVRVVVTPQPEIEEGQTAQISGVELIEGQYYTTWEVE